MDPFAICGYLWTAWVIVWLLWAFQSKETQQRESFESRMSYTIFVWASMYLMFFGKRLGAEWQSEIIPFHPWFGWMGVAVTVLGFAFTLWARFTLGSNWSGTVTIKVAHELIRTGPYRYVRHPIYTGMVAAMAGTALARDQWKGAAAVVLLWLSFSIKRLKEEEFMRQTFGAQYIDYIRTTGAIFPRLLRRDS
jgi:protein-S-isoprenylcysteine O-methyltransferase Ste14